VTGNHIPIKIQMPNKVPFFTVIIPVYNRSDLVGESIESVLAQEFKDFELIVVDDGSTDDSVEVLQHYALKDERITVVALPKNEGRCFARNTGLEKALGEWICYLDSDDTYYPNHLKVFFNLIQLNPEFYAFATEQNINGKNKKYRSRRLHLDNIDLSLNDFIENNPLTANQICYKRDLNVFWSSERIPISEDWLFMRELVLKTTIKKKAIVTNNLSDHPNRSMNIAQTSEFVKHNLLAANQFLQNNQVPSGIEKRILSYTKILCANVYLNNKEKKNAWVLFKESLKYPHTFSYSLFYKAIIKFFLV
jgi:glycosyltransferase involved in cell wall biosynthesis